MERGFAGGLPSQGESVEKPCIVQGGGEERGDAGFPNRESAGERGRNYNTGGTTKYRRVVL